MNLKIQFIYKNKDKKEFNKTEDTVLGFVKEGFEKCDPYYIIVIFNDIEMHIEFGEKCCTIQIADEKAGKMYGYINPEESEEPKDLYMNSYPKFMICHKEDDVLQIFKTFVATGDHDKNYQWEISNMA